ncbi:hypothetical protein QOT17_011877 [Balamuthia mandrillaris]
MFALYILRISITTPALPRSCIFSFHCRTHGCRHHSRPHCCSHPLPHRRHHSGFHPHRIHFSSVPVPAGTPPWAERIPSNKNCPAEPRSEKAGLPPCSPRSPPRASPSRLSPKDSLGKTADEREQWPSAWRCAHCRRCGHRDRRSCASHRQGSHRYSTPRTSVAFRSFSPSPALLFG